MFSIKRGARQLQVSEKYLRKLYRTGALRVVRFGRAVRIPEKELERLAAKGFEG
jgi:excisionase family DNA binding protein